MRNIMFDLAATIDTEKEFEQLTVPELVGAVRKRLDDILKENCIEAFGYSDEYELEDYPAPRDHNDAMSLMEINPHLAEARGGHWGR
jgi:hypothetical protein